jgi:hypothetical protein
MLFVTMMCASSAYAITGPKFSLSGMAAFEFNNAAGFTPVCFRPRHEVSVGLCADYLLNPGLERWGRTSLIGSVQIGSDTKLTRSQLGVKVVLLNWK